MYTAKYLLSFGAMTAFLLPIIFPAPTLASDAEPTALAHRLLSQSAITGGLVVHIGSGDPAAWGKLTAALGADRTYVVHGLYGNPDLIDRARRPIRTTGCYGRVSAEPWTGTRLPYPDNLVNVLVVGDGIQLTDVEQMRVLAPNGVALVCHNGQWQQSVKPRPAAIDDWSHVLHDATNNAVAQDMQVGPPAHLQWLALPQYTRHHERLASVSVVVSSGGRLFSIVDKAPAASMSFPPAWHVVARDAFSGVKLWERKISNWESYLDPFRSGPVALSRTLVATPDRVFVTLGLFAPVSALDAATGATLATYPASRGTEEILYDSGTLYLVSHEKTSTGNRAESPPSKESVKTKTVNRRGQSVRRGLLAIDTRTGKTRWKRPDCKPLATTLAVNAGHVYYAASDGVECLNAASGEPIWRSERRFTQQRPGWSAPTLVVHDDVVLCADRQLTTPNQLDELNHKRVAGWLAADGWPGDLIAYSAETGKQLWTCRCAETYHAPVDVFVADGLVWVGQSRSRTGPDFTFGRDLQTGEIKRRLDTARAFDTTMPHHRCHRNRATERYLVLGRTGIEFIDLKAGDPCRNHWVRGTCQFGVLPCNGLIYAPPHSCACYIEGKLTGFLALAPKTDRTQPIEAPDQHLIRGPAFGAAGSSPASSDGDPSGDWPTYRHDANRSGSTPHKIPGELGHLWQTTLGGCLTAPVIAAGSVYLASVDTHTVYALDATSGQVRWRFTTGGRVDSPPTVSAGRAVFGSSDGAVYCLRAADGELVWRFRASSAERRVVVNEQVESTWPVPGSVLIQRSSVYFVAGRSSYLDGGLRLYRLDLATGKELSQQRVDDRDPKTGQQRKETMDFEMPGALPDVLSSDGKQVYMRHLAYDVSTLESCEPQSHMFSPAGFLDDTWWHRTYWIVGRHFYSGYIGWYFAGRETPAGRLLVHNDRQLYGFGYRPDYYRGATERKYQLFALDQHQEPPQPPPDYKRANRDYPARGRGKFRIKFTWNREVPLLVRAMVLGEDKLIVAGPPARALRDASVYEGKTGGVLAVVDIKDGDLVKQYRLAALPVYDGMAVADSRLYLTTVDGHVHCLAATDTKGVQALPVVVPLQQRLPPLKVIQEPGLVGYWKLDEGEGPMARDSSGRKHDAEVDGRWLQDTSGTCVATDGRPNAISVPDNEDLHFGTESFSLALWIKLEDSDCRLLGKENFPENWWVINVLGNGRSVLVLGHHSRSGHVVHATSQNPIALNTWLHLAYVVDRKSRVIRCFVNGKLDSETAIPASFTDPLDVAGRELRIPSSHKPFHGSFDEVRVYRRPLLAEQLQAVYREGRSSQAGAQ